MLITGLEAGNFFTNFLSDKKLVNNLQNYNTDTTHLSGYKLLNNKPTTQLYVNYNSQLKEK